MLTSPTCLSKVLCSSSAGLVCVVDLVAEKGDQVMGCVRRGRSIHSLALGLYYKITNGNINSDQYDINSNES